MNIRRWCKHTACHTSRAPEKWLEKTKCLTDNTNKIVGNSKLIRDRYKYLSSHGTLEHNHSRFHGVWCILNYYTLYGINSPYTKQIYICIYIRFECAQKIENGPSVLIKVIKSSKLCKVSVPVVELHALPSSQLSTHLTTRPLTRSLFQLRS